jgi:hypothetical protein
MRFIVMHKVDTDMEEGRVPNAEIIKNMGAFIQGALADKVFENGAGLHRSARRARLEVQRGERKVTKGKFSGGNNLVQYLAMIRADSIDSAVDVAAQFANVFRDAEIEIGPLVEPWDLGFMPRPAEEKQFRYLLLHKAARDEHLSAETRSRLVALQEKLSGQGVLISADLIAPSGRGSRLASGAGGKRTWTDGPFAESKELVAGFSIINVPSKQDALVWADKYASILNGNEVDVREMDTF